MLNFERSGLSRKLTIISVLSTGSALLLVFAAFALTSILTHTDNQAKQVTSLADVICVNSVAPLLFADRVTATQALAALAVQDDIAQAVLYDRNGKPFATYPARGDDAVPPLDAAAMARLTGSEPALHTPHPFAPAMRVVRPVHAAGHLIGAVMIEVSQGPMWLGILKSLGITTVATAV
jgi:hypothetical protein